MNTVDQSLFQALLSVVQDGEKLQLKIECIDGKVNVVLIPELKAEDKPSDDKTVQQVRAALALPLFVRNVDPEQGLASLTETIMGFGDARSTAHSAYEELLISIKDATAAAKNASQTASKKAEPKKVIDDRSAESKPEFKAEAHQITEPEAPAEQAGGVLNF